jgi:diguanylate cyclase (GGDEF)-like protein
MTRLRSRGVVAGTLLFALCLLPAGIGAAMGQRSQARAALEAGLTHTANEQAEVLQDYFQRARSLTLLAAHDTAFQHFYAVPGSRVAKIRGNGRLMDEIDRGLGYLETLFPGSIGEACFIDRSGAEVARNVRGIPALLGGLSADESKNPFFAPTLALPIGAVYQAAPYVSPDTGEWVISNSTPLDTPDRSKPAILHFEVTVESFRAAAARDGMFGITVIDRATGRVVFDSHHRQLPGAALGSPGDARFAWLGGIRPTSGRLTVDGRPAAYQRVDRAAGNANDWIVVADAPSTVGALFGIGPMSIGLVVAAVLLLVLTGIIDLLARRELVSEAMTDPLTGLGNRRMLMRDLKDRLRTATGSSPLVLMLFDLNGFKAYNDTFGHSAGDDLLARLGRALAEAVPVDGRAYRLGGDEFCVLTPVDRQGVDPAVAAAAAALTEHGSGFRVDASYGCILLPAETQNPAEALRLVDQRMYAQKRSGRRSPDRQSQDVLLHALHERSPGLRAQSHAVGALVEVVSRRMGLPEDEVVHAVQAGELRDIGRVAIPDAILSAPAADLADDERAFLRHQTSVSERIIAAAPALTDVARLVRSTGEHVDGTGHPDGLRGSDIPLASRIVAACHRYVAIVHAAGNAPAAVAGALGTLGREAGSRFDPDVVDVLRDVVTVRGNADPSAPAPSDVRS